jgi:hypothetical protein
MDREAPEAHPVKGPTAALAAIAAATVLVLVVGCDREASSSRPQKEQASAEQLGVREALASGNEAALSEAVESAKRSGFPKDDLAVALSALQDELRGMAKRDAIVVALADLTLQAENNRFLAVPDEVKEKLLPELVRIQAGDRFPSNLRALSVLGSFNSEVAARTLGDIAVAGSDNHFKAAVNALSTMCSPLGEGELGRLKAMALSADRQRMLEEASRRGEPMRRVCR